MDGKMSSNKGSGGMYKPTGELQGDTSAMPNKGTGTAVTDTYGADIGVDSTNRQGSIGGSTKSDGMEAA